MTIIKDAPTGLFPDPLPLIGAGRPRSVSGGSHQHIYPATGRPTIEVPLAGPDDVDHAVATARGAAREWRDTPPNVRRRLLWQLAKLVEANIDELTAIQVAENGTPLVSAGRYVSSVVDVLEYYSGWPDKLVGQVHPVWPVAALDYSVREPHGVVAIIIPWNSPLFSVGTVVGPALAAGNTVIVKPPELTPFTSLRFAELALQAGIPAGVVNVVPGGAAVGAALVSHAGIDMIHFTGSGQTATRILQSAADNLTPVGLELGGKSPNLIFADADLESAAAAAVRYSFQNAGQGCVNGTRLLVEDAVFDDVVSLVKERAEDAYRVGDPVSPETTLGPVINQTAVDRILGMIDRAKTSSGGRVITGGARYGGEFAGGYFLQPTVIADVDPRAEIAQDEVFGPVLSVVRFSDEEQAVKIANDTKYGLASYIQTSDITRAHRLANELDTGMVWINGAGGLPPSIPFGGGKDSGVGRIGGLEGLELFSRTKNVWIAL